MEPYKDFSAFFSSSEEKYLGPLLFGHFFVLSCVVAARVSSSFDKVMLSLVFALAAYFAV